MVTTTPEQCDNEWPPGTLDSLAQAWDSVSMPAPVFKLTEFSKVAAWDWPIRDYQVEGMMFLHSHKRAWNNDDPGLGKTAQAAFAAEPPVLIVCPNYLVGTWFDWLTGRDEKSRAMHPESDKPVRNVKGTVRRIRGTGTEKTWQLRKQATDPASWVIINQEMMHSHLEVLMDLHFNTIILDEAHHFKTHTASRSRAAVELAKTAKFVYLLTATPIWKEADDLYNQFRILHPDLFTSYNAFIDTWCVADYSRFGPKVLGVKKEMIEPLRELQSTVAIRRTYDTAGRYLPRVIENFIKVEFPPKLRRTYDDLVLDYRAQLEGETIIIDNFSQMLNTLRQLTAYPGKMEAVKSLVEEDLVRQGKVVIFSWYRETAMRAANMFSHLGSVCITGDIKDPEERKKLAFKHPVVCATISSLSEGVDLSDARTVIFLEEHWPPGANKQALSRVRRDRNDDGTDRTPVNVYYVHVRGTIDEYIHRISQRRSGTIRELIREAVGLD